MKGAASSEVPSSVSAVDICAAVHATTTRTTSGGECNEAPRTYSRTPHHTRVFFRASQHLARRALGLPPRRTPRPSLEAEGLARSALHGLGGEAAAESVGHRTGDLRPRICGTHRGRHAYEWMSGRRGGGRAAERKGGGRSAARRQGRCARGHARLICIARSRRCWRRSARGQWPRGAATRTGAARTPPPRATPISPPDSVGAQGAVSRAGGLVWWRGRALVAPRAGRGREAQPSCAGSLWLPLSQLAMALWLSPAWQRRPDQLRAGASKPTQKTPISSVVLCRFSCVTAGGVWVGLGAALPAAEGGAARQARPQTHLLRLEPPMLRAIILHLAPPAQPHHQSARDVLDRPEVKGQQQHTHNKDVHEAAMEPHAEHVG